MWGCICNLKGRVEALEEGGGGGGGGGGFEFNFSDETAFGDPGTGFLAFNDAVAENSTGLYISYYDVNSNVLSDFYAWLVSIDNDWNGYVKITRKSDPTAFIVMKLEGGGDGTGFYYFNVDPDTPFTGTFVDGEALLVDFYPSGMRGIDGVVGADGVNAGFQWQFDSSTVASEPAEGYFRLNNATPISATALYITETAMGSVSLPAFLATWDDSTNTHKGYIAIRNLTNTAVFVVYSVTGTMTDNGAWDSFTIAGIAASGSFSSDDICDIQFIRTGDAGGSGFDYLFDTKTSSTDPGSGRLNVNNATLSSATRLYISETSNLGVSIAAYLATWDDSTNTIRGHFKMYSAANPAIFAVYSVTGSVTDNGAWDTFVIAHVVSSGTFTNSMPIKIEFYRAGDVGATGATGGATIQSFQTLTDGATVTWTADGSVAENNAVVTLAGNRTLAMSGWTSGMKGVLRVIQDGSGGRTLTLPATSTVPDGGGGAIALSTAGNAVDLVYVICHGTNLYHFILLPNLT